MRIWKLKDVLRLVNEDPDRPLICGGRTPVQGGGLTNVDTADIEDDAVTTPKINDLAVTLAKIANTSITNAKIAVAAAIAKSKISSTGTWTAAEIPNLNASKINAGQLALARGGTGQDFSSLSGNANKVLAVNSGESALELVNLNTIEQAAHLVTVKSANESVTSSTTLQNDDELLVAVAANKKYRFRMIIKLVDGGGELKYTMAVPSGTTGKFNDSTALNTDVGSTTTDSTNQYLIVQGYIETGGSSGNLQFQWAQNSSNGSATTIEAGSYIELYEVEQ